jgi:hypothetical protein
MARTSGILGEVQHAEQGLAISFFPSDLSGFRSAITADIKG